MEAANFKLNNFINIIDFNRLQIDGFVRDIQDIEPLAEKYRAFKWDVIDIDGHSIEQIIPALEKACQSREKPTLILARTIKGKGVSFMQDVAGWHGKPPNKDEMT